MPMVVMIMQVATVVAMVMVVVMGATMVAAVVNENATLEVVRGSR